MSQPAKQIIKHWLSRQEPGTEFTVKSIHLDLFYNTLSRETVGIAIKQLKKDGYVELTEMKINRSSVWIVLKGKENELSE